MADNVTVSDSTTTNSKIPDSTVIATDDVSGVQFQKIKVDLGGDGVSQVPDTNSGNKSAGTLRVVIATDQPALSNKLLVTPDLPSGAATAANQSTANTALAAIQTSVETLDNAISGSEMQVDVVGALPAGNNNIGDVDVASIAAGDNNIGNVDIVTVPADPFGANADAASATGSISAKLRFIASTGIPITGTVTVGSHAVTNAGTFAVQNTPVVASAASVTSVADTASSTTLLASNASRRGATIFNDSSEILYVKFGATASATDYTIKMAAGSYFEFPVPCYTGVVDGIWANNSTGAAKLTELT